MAVMPMMFNYGKKAVASYDWTDLTSGVGYKSYYACASDLTGGETDYLTVRVLDSSPWRQFQGNFTDASATKKHDVDFDITFGIPAVIEGKCFINVTNELYNNTGDTYCYIIVNVYHVGVPTSIGTAQTPTRTISAGTTRTYWRENILVDLTKRKFAVGDKLRLNVQWWGWVSSSIAQGGFYHDPASKTTFTDAEGNTVGTDLKMEVPFLINI